MRKSILAVTVLALPLLAARPAAAQQPGAMGQSVEFTAQVVDLSCKLQANLSGDSHRQCAQVCADAGIPLALLGQDGTLYIPLTEGMPGKSQNDRLRPHAEHTVRVKGKVVERAGLKGIILESVTM
ncbi:MAG: hypothetical protein HY704_06770 [Gemmatimonadetes bacterium]|nr:hypothetical protein [Gemmatimonadota bacterium]